MPEDEELDDTSPPEEVAEEVQYELEDGTPCDANGNPIEVEPEEPETPVVAEEPRPAIEYTSPYARTEPASDEAVTLTRAELRKEIQDAIRQDRVAIAQQQRAARDLGVGEEVFNELSAYMPQAESMVPNELKGTKAGATMALYAAMALDSEQNGFDVGKTLAKFSKTPVATEPKVQKVLAQSERTTTPRAGGNQGRPVVRKSFNSVAEAAVGGADVMKLIQAERKNYRG